MHDVTLPDGSVISFPDDMPDSAIANRRPGLMPRRGD
jgi:hypothetical protein